MVTGLQMDLWLVSKESGLEPSLPLLVQCPFVEKQEAGGRRGNSNGNNNSHCLAKPQAGHFTHVVLFGPTIRRF